jgi:hypothetical protein
MNIKEIDPETCGSLLQLLYCIYYFQMCRERLLIIQHMSFKAAAVCPCPARLKRTKSLLLSHGQSLFTSFISSLENHLCLMTGRNHADRVEYQVY